MQIVERAPVRGGYRGLDVVSFPYPGGGDIVVEALHILEAFPSELLREGSVDSLHVLLEAVHISMQDSGVSMWLPFLPRTFSEAASANRQGRPDSPRPCPARQRDLPRSGPHVPRRGHDASLGGGPLRQRRLTDPDAGRWQLRGHARAWDSTTTPCSSRTITSTEAHRCSSRRYGSCRPPCRRRFFSVMANHSSFSGAPGAAGSPALSSRLSPTWWTGECRSATQSPSHGSCSIWQAEKYKERIFVELAGTITPDKADELRDRGFRYQRRLTFPASQDDHYPFGGVNAVMVDPATGTLVGVGDPRRQGAAAAPRAP